MKNYLMTVELSWATSLEADNKKEAIKILKESFREDFNIELTDAEIVSVIEDDL